MRTTISIDDNLLAEAKRYALESGKSLTELIEDALREALARRSQPAAHEHIHLVTFGSGGLQPGVELDHSAALLDLMEDG